MYLLFLTTVWPPKSYRKVGMIGWSLHYFLLLSFLAVYSSLFEILWANLSSLVMS